MQQADSVAAPKSKALSPNPKDLFGAVKVSTTKLPAAAIAHAAHAMMDGARKYGAYNWRDKKVIASIYVDAATRHLLAWFEGEECASDSGVHHLGHAIACCAILLDAQETGNLIDDRPDGRGALSALFDRLNAAVKAKAEIALAPTAAAPPLADEKNCADGLKTPRADAAPLSQLLARADWYARPWGVVCINAETTASLVPLVGDLAKELRARL